MSTTFDLNSLGLAYGTYTITAKAKGQYWKDSPASAAATYSNIAETYPITYNLTNMTAPDITSITEGTTETVEFGIEFSYFMFPTNITVTGATARWDAMIGELVLSNPTGPVTITGAAERTYYKITTNLTGCKADENNPTRIAINADEGSCSLIFTPEWGNAFKSEPTVTGAVVEGWEIVTGENNQTMGVLHLMQPTSDVVITAVAESYLRAAMVDGYMYVYEDGMTWAEWIPTDYNTEGFKIVDGYILTADDSKRVEDPDMGAVASTNIMVDYIDYILVELVHTLATPTVEIDGTTLNIYDEEGLATEYDILVDGVVKETVALPTGKISVGGDWYDTIVIPASWIGSTWESKSGQVLEGESYSWTISATATGAVNITPDSHYTSGSLSYLDDTVLGSDTIAAVEYESDVYFN